MSEGSLSTFAARPRKAAPHGSGAHPHLLPVPQLMLRRFAPHGAGLLLILASGCSREPRHLNLSEASAFVVPDSVGVAGVALGPDGELLLWTPTQNRVVWIRGSARHDLTDPRLARPIAAAVLDPSMDAAHAPAGAVEALDAARGALIRFARDGRVLSVHAIPAWAGAVQAARARTGWFALLPDSSSGRGYSVQFQEDGTAAPRRVFVMKGSGSAKARTVRLSVWGDSLIVTEVRSPYASMLVPNAATGAHRLATPSGIPELRQTRYTWLSMPLLPVGRGFIQVFADAGSDRRLFVTYGRDRRPVHASFVDAPIGLIAARTAPDVLLALRRVGRTEVVQYRWEWTR